MLGLEEQQENGGNQDKGRDGILEYDSPSYHDDIPSWNERLIFTSEEVPASEEAFASAAELCSVNFSLSPL